MNWVVEKILSRRLFLLTLACLLVSTAGCSKDKSGASQYSLATPKAEAQPKKTKNAGFDIDDTLLFSSPAFARAIEAEERFGSDEFWRIVNASDREFSIVKKSVLEIVKKHRAAGDNVYAITSRRDIGGDDVRNFITEAFGIPTENVYFEPKGKVKRMRKLSIDIFYGDSDRDIEDAQEAGAEAVRIERSPKSDNKKNYNPGKFDEKILTGTEE